MDYIEVEHLVLHLFVNGHLLTVDEDELRVTQLGSVLLVSLLGQALGVLLGNWWAVRRG